MARCGQHTFQVFGKPHAKKLMNGMEEGDVLYHGLFCVTCGTTREVVCEDHRPLARDSDPTNDPVPRGRAKKTRGDGKRSGEAISPGVRTTSLKGQR